MSRNERVSCESCTYYIYDEDYESYVCDKNMDEDEYIRLMTDRHYDSDSKWQNFELFAAGIAEDFRESADACDFYLSDESTCK